MISRENNFPGNCFKKEYFPGNKKRFGEKKSRYFMNCHKICEKCEKTGGENDKIIIKYDGIAMDKAWEWVYNMNGKDVRFMIMFVE